MGKDWESTFINWSKPPSVTEEEKCKNTIKQIKEALSNVKKITNCEVFVQGSYQNNTNIRVDSDVDVCICYNDTFFPHYPDDMGKSYFGNEDSKFSYSEFKSLVEKALVDKFGKESIVRGNKAFKINSSSSRVNADVVACFEHRRYNADKSYRKGTEFTTDDGISVINWPKQHYENGAGKNNDTSRMYKNIVRIIKKLNLHMHEDELNNHEKVPSFLIECLIWNIPNKILITGNTYLGIVLNSLQHLKEKLSIHEEHTNWGEVSELLYLFKGNKPWTPKKTHSFLVKSIDYLEK